MKALKYIFFLLLILIIGSSIYIATLNGKYDLKQTKQLSIPIEVVFDEINDYKNWQNWGPWYEMDSTIIASYEGNTVGEGGYYSWTGKEGAGSMKTLISAKYDSIIQQIDFGTGSIPEVYWKFTKLNEGTEVTWGMRGESSFGEKMYWLFNGGIEKNMLPMYERGLELLDVHLTKEINKYSIEAKGVVDFGGGFYLYQTTSCKTEEIGPKSGEMFTAIQNYMTTNAIEASGKPFSISHKWDEANNTTMFSACVPVKERIITTGNVNTGLLAGQKTFKTVLTGSYTYLYEAWEKAYKLVTEQGFEPVENGEPFEIYTVGPHDVKNPAKYVTEIYIPIK